MSVYDEDKYDYFLFYSDLFDTITYDVFFNVPNEYSEVDEYLLQNAVLHALGEYYRAIEEKEFSVEPKDVAINFHLLYGSKGETKQFNSISLEELIKPLIEE